MLIQTNADAQEALQELANDITATKTTQVPQIGVADGGLFGFLGLNSPGSSDVQAEANSLLDQLAGYVQDEYDALDGSDTPLTDQQIAKMKLIQSQVQDARSTVQSTISDLDWTFGQFVSDSISAAVNIADTAAGAVAGGLGINWTVAKIGIAVALAGLGYALFLRVRGT
jgi:hypothetical protein